MQVHAAILEGYTTETLSRVRTIALKAVPNYCNGVVKIWQCVHLFCIGRRSVTTDVTYKAPKHPLLTAVPEFLCRKEVANS